MLQHVQNAATMTDAERKRAIVAAVLSLATKDESSVWTQIGPIATDILTIMLDAVGNGIGKYQSSVSTTKPEVVEEAEAVVPEGEVAPASAVDVPEGEAPVAAPAIAVPEGEVAPVVASDVVIEQPPVLPAPEPVVVTATPDSASSSTRRRIVMKSPRVCLRLLPVSESDLTGLESVEEPLTITNSTVIALSDAFLKSFGSILVNESTLTLQIPYLMSLMEQVPSLTGAQRTRLMCVVWKHARDVYASKRPENGVKAPWDVVYPLLDEIATVLTAIARLRTIPAIVQSSGCCGF